MTPDMINGTFELVGAFLVGNHCRVIMKEKEVRGVSVFSTAIFTVWGLWNIYFYSNLDQWCSFYGSLLLMAVNSTYVLMLLHYRNKQPKSDTVLPV
jgi:uncharacterized membrane protein YfhO